MVSSSSTLEHIKALLSDLDGITSRPMMGEYLLYYKGRCFGGIYDDRFLVKITPCSEEYLNESEKQTPYDGAKEMFLVTSVNGEFLTSLIETMYTELPEPKKKR